MSDQDFKQKVGMYIAFITEFYRALMGSFLVLFVPQKCGDHICGMSDVVSTGNDLKDSAFSFNVIVFVLFLHMYFAEIRRETKMIDYLHINPELPRDNDAVGEALVRLPEEKRNCIWLIIQNENSDRNLGRNLGRNNSHRRRTQESFQVIGRYTQKN